MQEHERDEVAASGAAKWSLVLGIAGGLGLVQLLIFIAIWASKPDDFIRLHPVRGQRVAAVCSTGAGSCQTA